MSQQTVQFSAVCQYILDCPEKEASMLMSMLTTRLGGKTQVSQSRPSNEKVRGGARPNRGGSSARGGRNNGPETRPKPIKAKVELREGKGSLTAPKEVQEALQRYIAAKAVFLSEHPDGEVKTEPSVAPLWASYEASRKQWLATVAHKLPARTNQSSQVPLPALNPPIEGPVAVIAPVASPEVLQSKN